MSTPVRRKIATEFWNFGVLLREMVEYPDVPDGECAADGHRQTIDMTTMGDPGTVTTCACGRITNRAFVR